MFAVKAAETRRVPVSSGPSVEPVTGRRLVMPSDSKSDKSSLSSRPVDRQGSFKTQNGSESSSGRSKLEHCEGSLQLELVIESQSDVMCLRFSPEGNLLAAGFADGQIKIYSMELGQCVYCLTPDDHKQNRLPVTSVRFTPNVTSSDGTERKNILMATYTTGHVRFWHYTSGKCVQTINELRHSKQTLSSAYNPAGDRIATVGADPQIYLYDVKTKQRINTLEATDSRDKMDGHRCRVFAVQYSSSESNVFLTGGWDDTVQFWDDRSRHSFRKISGPHICGDALDIDPVHGHILTGSWRKDTPLQIWDFSSGEKIKDVPDDLVNNSLLYCAQWLGKDNIICGGNSKNLARVLDRSTFNSIGQLVDLPQGVYCIDNDRQGSRPRVAIGASRKIYLARTYPLVSSLSK